MRLNILQRLCILVGATVILGLFLYPEIEVLYYIDSDWEVVGSPKTPPIGPILNRYRYRTFILEAMELGQSIAANPRDPNIKGIIEATPIDVEDLEREGKAFYRSDKILFGSMVVHMTAVALIAMGAVLSFAARNASAPGVYNPIHDARRFPEG
jgi:hypothetical protein